MTYFFMQLTFVVYIFLVIGLIYQVFLSFLQNLFINFICLAHKIDKKQCVDEQNRSKNFVHCICQLCRHPCSPNFEDLLHWFHLGNWTGTDFVSICVGVFGISQRIPHICIQQTIEKQNLWSMVSQVIQQTFFHYNPLHIKWNTELFILIEKKKKIIKIIKL